MDPAHVLVDTRLEGARGGEVGLAFVEFYDLHNDKSNRNIS